MRTLKILIIISVTFLLAIGSASYRPLAASQTISKSVSALQANTLCAKNERVIFSCPIRKPAKIVSVCASRDLTSEKGYLQYRFGLPGKIELEFPKERTATRTKFQYTHYFRAQVDLTEITFSINGYEYQVIDEYNGEEKPAQTIQGVSVTAPGKPKE